MSDTAKSKKQQESKKGCVARGRNGMKCKLYRDQSRREKAQARRRLRHCALYPGDVDALTALEASLGYMKAAPLAKAKEILADRPYRERRAVQVTADREVGRIRAMSKWGHEGCRTRKVREREAREQELRRRRSESVEEWS